MGRNPYQTNACQEIPTILIHITRSTQSENQTLAQNLPQQDPKPLPVFLTSFFSSSGFTPL
jgi:hypothetical protein